MTIGATWKYIVPWKVMFKLWGRKKRACQYSLAIYVH